MNFHVDNDSRSPDVTMPTAIKMIPAMIIAAARKNVTERRLLPSCELLPLKNEPVGVCADAVTTPSSSIKAAAIGPFKAFIPNASVTSLRPIWAARESSRPGTFVISIKLFIFPILHEMILRKLLARLKVFRVCDSVDGRGSLQPPCHEVGPSVAHAARTMTSRLIQSISILLVLTATTMAQG